MRDSKEGPDSEARAGNVVEMERWMWRRRRRRRRRDGGVDVGKDGAAADGCPRGNRAPFQNRTAVVQEKHLRRDALGWLADGQ